jgi:hypothetical protein
MKEGSDTPNMAMYTQVRKEIETKYEQKKKFLE